MWSNLAEKKFNKQYTYRPLVTPANTLGALKIK